MVGKYTYACTARGNVDGNSYVKFVNTKLTWPLQGMDADEFFSSKEVNGRRLPTTNNLIAAEDVYSFADLPLLEVCSH